MRILNVQDVYILVAELPPPDRGWSGGKNPVMEEQQEGAIVGSDHHLSNDPNNLTAFTIIQTESTHPYYAWREHIKYNVVMNPVDNVNKGVAVGYS